MGSRSKNSKKGKQKKPPTEWRQCNHCRVIVYFKDEKCHFDECCARKLTSSDSEACNSPLKTTKLVSLYTELQHCYFYNGVLHAEVSGPKITGLDWKNVPLLRNIILMHPSAMRLCKIPTGKYVTVTGNNYEAIHVAWPCSFLDQRSVALRRLKRIFHFPPGSKVTIQNYTGTVRDDVKEVALVPVEPEEGKDFYYCEEFRNYIWDDLYTEVLKVGMTITCKYWGSRVKLKVTGISYRETPETELCSFNERSLNEQMENMNIQDVSDSAEKSVSINESYNDSLCDQSTDSSLNLCKSNLLTESGFSFSTPISSTKAGCSKLSFSRNFATFDNSQNDPVVSDLSEEAYFKVTEFSAITVHRSRNVSLKKTTLDDIGGLKDQLHAVNSSMQKLFSQKYVGGTVAEKYEGVLLYGPTGTGKTLVAQAMEAECGLPLINVTANEMIVRHYGSEEKEVQKRFEEAIKKAPCILLLDQIDKLCCWEQDATERKGEKMFATLVRMFDKLKENLENPVLILATARDNTFLHPRLRTYDRFSVEIEFKIPSPSKRYEILQKLARNHPHNLTCEELLEISNKTHAYTGSDLAVLYSVARLLAISKCLRNGIEDKKEMEKVLSIDFLDMINAMKKVTPFAMINQEVKIEKVSWDDICGMYEVKKRLQQAVEWPLKYPGIFSRYNINPTSGILMHGPPGCSKTMLAKALASESGLNFIPVKGPELFNKFYGESERAVRELFARARASKPCIVFLDEVDALLAGRESSSDGTDVGRKVVCQFLSEFGGIGACDGIIVIAATKRPDILDEAVLRPGRIGELVEVPLPDADTKKEIFEKKLKEMPVSDDIDFALLLEKTRFFWCTGCCYMQRGSMALS